MRGNLPEPPVSDCGRGTIPAHAGEPGAIRVSGDTYGDYPRACGGTITARTIGTGTAGLSPRMRGNRLPECA